MNPTEHFDHFFTKAEKAMERESDRDRRHEEDQMRADERDEDDEPISVLIVPAAGERMEGEVPVVKQAPVPAEIAALESALSAAEKACSKWHLAHNSFRWRGANERRMRVATALGVARRRAAIGGNDELCGGGPKGGSNAR